MFDFEACTLLISARSPFARRVRVAFLENGIPFEEKTLDVLKPVPELWDRNPLARVPTAVLRSGETIFDSNLILQLFYEAPRKTGFSGGSGARLEGLLWSTLAVGLAEKIVEYFFETLRPEAQRDPVVTDELKSISERVLAKAEKTLATREWLLGENFTQADIDLGVALAYLCLRHSAEWKKSYPRCAAFLGRLEERPSFRATIPPPPAS